jgi:pentose-5-phosphate-3-epimerase
MKAKISPSIMCADFGHLEEEIRILTTKMTYNPLKAKNL